MIKHIWSVLCRKTVIDSDTNNISLLDVFEQLSIDVTISDTQKLAEKVNIPIDYELVSLWLRSNGKSLLKADVEIDIIDPENEKIKTFNQKLEIPTKFKRMRSRLRIKGFTATTSGNYIFRVKIKEENQKDFTVVAELPLEVVLKKKAQKSNSTFRGLD